MTGDTGDAALDLDAQERALRDERRQLTEDADSSRDAGRPVELDQQAVGRLSRMDAMQVQAMAKAAEERRKLRLRRIDAALKRLADGDYGDCLRCGEPIEPKRLVFDPTVTLCRDCQSN
jgi:DnaK suppressor protein